MTKLLLIWEEVPEATRVYVFDGESHEAELARQSAGLFINLDDIPFDHPIHALGDAVEKLADLGITKILEGPFDEVVICGFML